MHSKALYYRFNAGFQRFQKTWYCREHNLYEDLREGQSPFAMIIACSDSRVDPVLLLDATPGELFIIRNVANLVPPYQPDANYHGVSAALEYGIKYLKIPHIIVMGHAQCAGFFNLLDENKHADDEFINIWMDLALRVKVDVEKNFSKADSAERQRACEMGGIKHSLKNLRSYPFIVNAVKKGELALHGLYFDMGTGELLYYDSKKHVFKLLTGTCFDE